MNILLTAINAKYIHSNLAIYDLKAYAHSDCVHLAEYTINQLPDDILIDIYKKKPDVLCFSCYIWNIDYVCMLSREIAKLLPKLQIWLGGPEVSYDSVQTLERMPEVKGIMKGEGEETFREFCKLMEASEDADDEASENTGDEASESTDDEASENISSDGTVADTAMSQTDRKLASIRGITFRTCTGEIRENPWREIMSLSDVPFVYQDIDTFAHKIIYYETSRGCPFSCSYCLSSVDKKLRFRDTELAKKELQFFIDSKVPQVKFVDRTFNCNHRHAMEIWRYLAEHDQGYTNFHFEVAADLLNEEELSLLETVRPGLFQLEIGVQSTNPKTIREIRRVMDFDRVREVVNRIQKAGNIHQHLDLIAGLPYEDIVSFAESFDNVYELKPEQFQLGFLKVLKGSFMETQKENYGLVCQERSPYEVLYTRWLSYEDVIRLKGIEEMVEVYYNSRQFTHTLEYLEKEYSSAFTLYDELAKYYEARRYHEVKHKRSARYEILLSYVSERHPLIEKRIRELLTYDYYLRENAKTRPEFAGEYLVDKDFLRHFYETESEEHAYLKGYESCDRNQMRKMTHIEYFETTDTYLLFDYLSRNPLNQEAYTCKISGKSIK